MVFLYILQEKDFVTTFKNFDSLGLDLFKKLIAIDPSKRISMK